MKVEKGDDCLMTLSAEDRKRLEEGRLTTRETNLIHRYIAEVVIFIAKREKLDQEGGCGDVVMVYHQNLLEYGNYHVTDKISLRK